MTEKETFSFLQYSLRALERIADILGGMFFQHKKALWIEFSVYLKNKFLWLHHFLFIGKKLVQYVKGISFCQFSTLLWMLHLLCTFNTRSLIEI